MKRLALLLVVALLTACAGQAVKDGSSPKVPKAAIEKGADTKIPDAGTDPGDTHAP